MSKTTAWTMLWRGCLREVADLRHHEAAGGEQLARTCIACHPEGAGIKVGVRKCDRTRVCIRIACDLAQNPVIPARVSQHKCRNRSSASDKSENGKGTSTTEPTGRRDHAASSSGLFQSVASAASLSRAVMDSDALLALPRLGGAGLLTPCVLPAGPAAYLGSWGSLAAPVWVARVRPTRQRTESCPRVPP